MGVGGCIIAATLQSCFHHSGFREYISVVNVSAFIYCIL